jgi:hypothetical protein
LKKDKKPDFSDNRANEVVFGGCFLGLKYPLYPIFRLSQFSHHLKILINELRLGVFISVP